MPAISVRTWPRDSFSSFCCPTYATTSPIRPTANSTSISSKPSKRPLSNPAHSSGILFVSLSSFSHLLFALRSHSPLFSFSVVLILRRSPLFSFFVVLILCCSHSPLFSFSVVLILRRSPLFSFFVVLILRRSHSPLFSFLFAEAFFCLWRRGETARCERHL